MKFRKKPIMVEAETVGIYYSVDTGYWASPSCVVKRRFRKGWWVKTLEGWCRVRQGDWIITGIKGEKYPCRVDIFEETYEKVGK